MFFDAVDENLWKELLKKHSGSLLLREFHARRELLETYFKVVEEYENSPNKKEELSERLHFNVTYQNLEEKSDDYLKSLEEGQRLFETTYTSHMKSHYGALCRILANLIVKRYSDKTDIFQGNIFDLGCGTGAVLRDILPTFAFSSRKSKLIEVDRSPYMLTQAFINIERAYHTLEFLEERGIYQKGICNRIKSNIDIRFIQDDIVDLNPIIQQEGTPETIVVSYCFHWLNRYDLVSKTVESIHKHLKKDGWFVSIEEWPLRIGFEKDAVNSYIQKCTSPINLDRMLYPLIRQQSFISSGPIVYNIDTNKEINPDNSDFLPQHKMYGVAFQKVIPNERI